jgi:hypothetical protein
MEGIMNLPANVGGATSQDGLDSFAPLIAAQQAARDMGYPRFTRELLSAGSEMDQAEVQEFLQTIRDAGLTSDDVAMMRRVVEAVFGDPNNYPEVRSRLLAEGVPEDILPETFDLEFFVALRMAVEESENIAREPRPTGQEMSMDMPVQMAEGGIVGLPQMTPIAREMAAMGRNGDTMLAHITPQEAMMLQRMGGSGTINPYTGLPEFFLKKLFRGIGKAIKGVAKGIKKFAKSKIGRIVLSVALGAFLGPAAAGFVGASSTAAVAAVSGAVGGFGSSILAGDDLKTALRNGVTSAALAGGTAAVMGGSSAFQARPELDVAYQQQGFMGTVKKTAQNYFGSPVDTANQMYGSAPDPGGIKTAQDFVTQPAVGDATAQLGYGDVPYDSFGQGPPGLTGKEYFQGSPGTSGFSLEEFNKNVLLKKVDPSLLDYKDQFVGPQSPAPVRPVTQGPQLSSTGAQAQGPQLSSTGAQAQVPRLTEPSFLERGYDTASSYLSPTRASIQPPTLAEAMQKVQADAAAGGITLKPETIYSKAQEIVAKETPGMLAKYGPIAAVAGTTLAATGGLDSLFKVPVPEGMTQEEFDAQRAEKQAQFRKDSPQFFGSITRPEYYSPPTYLAAKGSGPEGVEDFPRKTGAINGPGTGTSDDIPAMLSDGEFVFTAKSVRNMGGGSRRKGAAKMYKLMKMLEGGPVSKTAGA